jgi:hypothetical protein
MSCAQPLDPTVASAPVHPLAGRQLRQHLRFDTYSSTLPRPYRPCDTYPGVLT